MVYLLCDPLCFENFASCQCPSICTLQSPIYLPEAPLVGRLRVEHVIGLHHALPAAAELGRFRVEHAFARAIDRGEFVHV